MVEIAQLMPERPHIDPRTYADQRSVEYKKILRYCQEQHRGFVSDLEDFRDALEEQADLGRFEARLTDLAGVCVNNPKASFWLQRRGTEVNVGRPVTKFKTIKASEGGMWSEPRREKGEDIGICLRRPDIVSAKYLRFWFEMLWRKGFWRQHNYGTLNLRHIRVSDARDLIVAFKP